MPRSLVVIVLLMSLVLTTVAQRTGSPRPTGAAPTDPQIAAVLKEVSAEQIRRNIEKLVSFGNRNTLSATDEASVKKGFGIGAARAWIKSELERYSKAC